MYTDFASWWPILSAPEDYVEEATFYANTLLAAARRPSRTLLELGSGGGNNASHMKKCDFWNGPAIPIRRTTPTPWTTPTRCAKAMDRSA